MLERQIVDLDHDAVDLEVELPATLLPFQTLRHHLVLATQQLDIAVDRELPLAQPLQRLGVALEGEALRDADLIGPERQRALGGIRRVELTDRPGGRVARVHERRLARFRAALVQRREVRERHVDLAAHLHELWRVRQPLGDRADRAQVVRHVLPHLAVPARGSQLQHAIAIDEAHRQAVDLRLDHVLKGRLGDPLACQVIAHALHPCPQLLLGAHVVQ